MQLREIITGYSEKLAKYEYINTVYGQNTEVLDVKAGGEYSCQCVLKNFQDKA
jgi:hypothetical protein